MEKVPRWMNLLDTELTEREGFKVGYKYDFLFNFSNRDDVECEESSVLDYIQIAESVLDGVEETSNEYLIIQYDVEGYDGDLETVLRNYNHGAPPVITNSR